LTDLDFADDLALVANNTEVMQEMKVGISDEKTKLQLIRQHGGHSGGRFKWETTRIH